MWEYIPENAPEDVHKATLSLLRIPIRKFKIIPRTLFINLCKPSGPNLLQGGYETMQIAKLPAVGLGCCTSSTFFHMGI